MIQLSRSMMERYEIPDSRPENIRAVIFGADSRMLGGCARLLGKAGVGAVCISRDAELLNKQDGMFTLLVRGESADGKKIDREEVIQSIISAVNPQEDFDSFLKLAGNGIEMLICHADCGDVEAALTARLLVECKDALPVVLLAHDQCDEDQKRRFMEEISLIASGWGDAGWLEKLDVRLLLCDSLSAPLDEKERAIAKHRMNYADEFIAWAEPHCAFAVEGGAPGCLKEACVDFDRAVLLKQRVFDAAVFMCTSAGYLCGMENFAKTLKDEQLRGWIGKSFYEELLPLLPEGREEAIISAFERLENPMNNMPLLEVGRNLLLSFPKSVLPALRDYADEHFEAPQYLSLALSAAIMLYAGARRDEKGSFCVERGQGSDILHDDVHILEAFSRLAHDMPAESLAYAALADRSIWGMDLREIDGLEMRVMYDLSSIQRIGFRETLKMRMED